MVARKEGANRLAPEIAEELLLMGRFFRPHGLKGEVKVIPETDAPDHFAELETIYVGQEPELASGIPVQSVRFQQTKHGVTVILKLEGVETPEGAAALRDQLVFARESDLPELDEDEVYLHDLVGLAVITEGGEEIGTISDVLEMPGHVTYVVDRPGRQDAWIPAVPEFVIEVDLDAERIVIRPIEGLLE
jgi:16S rRNA processing protein RimM